ncbi:hypothetical protein Tco_0195030 [Tanacetum coccineum]
MKVITEMEMVVETVMEMKEETEIEMVTTTMGMETMVIMREELCKLPINGLGMSLDMTKRLMEPVMYGNYKKVGHMSRDYKTPASATNQRAPLANQKATEEMGKLEEELMPLEEEEKPIRNQMSLWGATSFWPRSLKRRSKTSQRGSDLKSCRIVWDISGSLSEDLAKDVAPCSTRNEKEHEEHLKLILELLKHEELYAKFSKSEFWLPKVQFLGHVIDSEGIHGLADFIDDFSRGFSKIAKPMTKLTQKSVKFDWGEKEEEAFQQLKQKLRSALILSLMEGTENFVVYYDYYTKGLG